MGQAEKQRETNNPRDLIQRLIFSNFTTKFEEAIEDEESIELSLGLSLNGRFGVDRQREQILSRSSSVSDFVFANEKQSDMNGACVEASLMRTCSLPAEGEEERKKRKEVQSLRRMEAKRKRVEKLRNLKSQGENLKSQGQLEGIIPPIPSSHGSIGSSGSSGVCESGSQPNQGGRDYPVPCPGALCLSSTPQLCGVRTLSLGTHMVVWWWRDLRALNNFSCAGHNFSST